MPIRHQNHYLIEWCDLSAEKLVSNIGHPHYDVGDKLHAPISILLKIFLNSYLDLFILDSVRSVITDSFASWFSTTGQNDGIIGNQGTPDDVMQRANQNWTTTEANIEYNTNENSNSPFEKSTYRIVWDSESSMSKNDS